MNSESMLFTSFLFKFHLLRYLQGGCSDVVTSLDGPQLDNDLGKYFKSKTLKINRLSLFNKHFIDGQKRADVGV